MTEACDAVLVTRGDICVPASAESVCALLSRAAPPLEDARVRLSVTRAALTVSPRTDEGFESDPDSLGDEKTPQASPSDTSSANSSGSDTEPEPLATLTSAFANGSLLAVVKDHKECLIFDCHLPHHANALLQAFGDMKPKQSFNNNIHDDEGSHQLFPQTQIKPALTKSASLDPGSSEPSQDTRDSGKTLCVPSVPYALFQDGLKLSLSGKLIKEPPLSLQKTPEHSQHDNQQSLEKRLCIAPTPNNTSFHSPLKLFLTGKRPTDKTTPAPQRIFGSQMSFETLPGTQGSTKKLSASSTIAKNTGIHDNLRHSFLPGRHTIDKMSSLQKGSNDRHSLKESLQRKDVVVKNSSVPTGMQPEQKSSVFQQKTVPGSQAQKDVIPTSNSATKENTLTHSRTASKNAFPDGNGSSFHAVNKTSSSTKNNSSRTSDQQTLASHATSGGDEPRQALDTNKAFEKSESGNSLENESFEDDSSSFLRPTQSLRQMKLDGRSVCVSVNNVIIEKRKPWSLLQHTDENGVTHIEIENGVTHRSLCDILLPDAGEHSSIVSISAPDPPETYRSLDSIILPKSGMSKPRQRKPALFIKAPKTPTGITSSSDAEALVPSRSFWDSNPPGVKHHPSKAATFVVPTKSGAEPRKVLYPKEPHVVPKPRTEFYPQNCFFFSTKQSVVFAQVVPPPEPRRSRSKSPARAPQVPWPHKVLREFSEAMRKRRIKDDFAERMKSFTRGDSGPAKPAIRKSCRGTKTRGSGRRVTFNSYATVRLLET